jgi:hypothetical protein
VFTPERVFTMQSYHLAHRGHRDLVGASLGKYRVQIKAHKDGREEVLNCTLDLPHDVYNGMIITVAKTSPRVQTPIVLKPRLGSWPKLFATLLGRAPPDSHAWIIQDELSAFVRFEGPLVTMGPVWRIETTSPCWPGCRSI